MAGVRFLPTPMLLSPEFHRSRQAVTPFDETLQITGESDLAASIGPESDRVSEDLFVESIRPLFRDGWEKFLGPRISETTTRREYVLLNYCAENVVGRLTDSQGTVRASAQTAN